MKEEEKSKIEENISDFDGNSSEYKKKKQNQNEWDKYFCARSSIYFISGFALNKTILCLLLLLLV